jgi:hypothetical protein
MPPKKITIQAGQKGQGSFSAFLTKGAASDDNKILAVLPSHLNPVSPMSIASTAVVDPQITAFMASLTPSEQIAHTIAKDKLGTSYDIRRTHGFVRWSASKAKTA